MASEQAGLCCPRCQFAFSPRVAFMTPDYCPRCLAFRRVAQRRQHLGAETVGGGLAGAASDRSEATAFAVRVVVARDSVLP
jgi:hypothetical protein